MKVLRTGEFIQKKKSLVAYVEGISGINFPKPTSICHIASKILPLSVPNFHGELKYPHSFLFYFYFGHLKYIYPMEAHYKTLQTIYTITKDDPQPERYKCRPREIILRQFQDWTIIQTHLQLLEDEELVTTNQEDTLVVCITSAGISKILNSENSAVAK